MQKIGDQGQAHGLVIQLMGRSRFNATRDRVCVLTIVRVVVVKSIGVIGIGIKPGSLSTRHAAQQACAQGVGIGQRSLEVF